MAPEPDPLSTAVLSRCRGALEGPRGARVIEASLAPTAAERAMLAARSEVLDAALRPAGKGEAQRMIAALFALIPVGRDDAGDVTEQIGLYGAALASQPIWAVGAACRAIVDGGRKFRPGAPELVVLARAACEQAFEERARLGELLGARVVAEIGEEERARVRAGFREGLLAALRGKVDGEPSVRRAQGEGAA